MTFMQKRNILLICSIVGLLGLVGILVEQFCKSPAMHDVPKARLSGNVAVLNLEHVLLFTMTDGARGYIGFTDIRSDCASFFAFYEDEKLLGRTNTVVRSSGDLRFKKGMSCVRCGNLSVWWLPPSSLVLPEDVSKVAIVKIQDCNWTGRIGVNSWTWPSVTVTGQVQRRSDR